MTTTLNFDQLLEWDKYELIEQIILLQNKINKQEFYNEDDGLTIQTYK